VSRELEGQWALVTGGGRGIGRALAVGLASRGASVALASRTAAELEQTAEACRKAGAPKTALFPTDLLQKGKVDELAQAAQEKCGAIDILVNNAGIAIMGNALEGDPDRWEPMVDLILAVPMRLVRRIAPGMVERQRGMIINVGGVSGVEPMKKSAISAAVYHGVRGFSLSTYEALRDHGIKVTLLNLAYVNTPMVQDVKNARFDRMMTPEDVAEAALLSVRTSPMCCPQEITLRLTKRVFE